MNDKAIEFEATNFRLVKTMKTLKDSGLNIDKYERVYNNIILQLNNKNKTIPESIINTSESFATDYLSINYMEAIKQLEKLFNELKKYEIYVRVAAFSEYLKRFINKQNKLKEEFNLYRENLIDIINKLIKSNTLDYDVEGSIIEKIYKITYYFIKEEIKIIGYSKTLDILVNNPINISYLDKQIVKELESIDLKDVKYINLMLLKKQIDSQGFNSNYVTNEFIKELVINSLNHKNIEETIEILIDEINDQIKDIKEIDLKIDDNKSEISKRHKKIKDLKKDLIRPISLFITSGGIIAGLIIGSVKLAKYKAYNTTTSTYSPKDGIITESDYCWAPYESTLIYEVTPYIKSADSFTRIKTVYDVSKIENLSFPEYLNLDLESLGIKGDSKNESKSQLDLDDLYEETFRYIKQVIVDKEDYQSKTSVIGLIALLLLSFLIYIPIEYIFLETGFNDDDFIALLASIEEIADIVTEICETKAKENEYNVELNELNEKSKKLIIENKELIDKLLNYYEIIKNNPEFKKENEKITNTLKLVKKEK